MMSDKEAVEVLIAHRIRFMDDFGWNKTTLEALDIAIASLATESKPVVKGKWINRDATFMECSACQALYLKQIDSGLGKAHWANPNFCPNCGADMRKETKDE